MATNIYQEFKNFLFNNSELEETTCKILMKKFVLCMFYSIEYYEVSIFIDKYFNNFKIERISNIDFFNHMKKIVKKYNLSYYQLSYYKHGKIDKLLLSEIKFAKLSDIRVIEEIYSKKELDEIISPQSKKIKKKKTTKAERSSLQSGK